jgi:NSS family neurotransmitter:Na+ symporter
MKKDISIKKSVHQIEIFDTGIAFLAGLMIIPACVAFDPSQLTKGPGLMFGVLPRVFNNMFGGAVIGTLFFLMVLLAALTSSISLMETVVASVQDNWKINRKISCLIVLAISLILGLLSCLGYSEWSEFYIFGKFQILDMFDFATNNIMMPIIALLTCVLVGYIIDKKPIVDEIYNESNVKSRIYFTIMLKFVVPVCLMIILVFSILEGVGVISV